MKLYTEKQGTQITDEKEKQISIVVIMVIVLICLLFVGLMGFGYMSGPSGSNGSNNGSNVTSGSPTTGKVTGTIFYNDGVTPLILNNSTNGTDVQLFNTSTSTVISTFVTDNTGKFISPEVPAGNYVLYGYYNNSSIGHTYLTIVANSTIQKNLTTSRMPAN